MPHSTQRSQSESTQRETESTRRWPDWTGRTVVCLATGPSLTAVQVAHVAGARGRDACRVIAINEAGLEQYAPLAAPWADILYAADSHWWRHYFATSNEVQPGFIGLRVSGEPVVEVKVAGIVYPSVDTIPMKMLEFDKPMPRAPGELVSGGHSGFQALGLALSLGAAEVILLGFDCGGLPRNCHLDRPEQFMRDANFDEWAKKYDRVPGEWKGVTFWTCSVRSRLVAFDVAPLEDVL